MAHAAASFPAPPSPTHIKQVIGHSLCRSSRERQTKDQSIHVFSSLPPGICTLMIVHPYAMAFQEVRRPRQVEALGDGLLSKLSAKERIRLR